MELVTSFEVVLQSVATVMTAPSFQTWLTLVTGWVFARRRTVTQMIVAAGAVEGKHFSSRDELGLAIFALLERWLGATVFLGVDDTLARKRGLKLRRDQPGRARRAFVRCSARSRARPSRP